MFANFYNYYSQLSQLLQEESWDAAESAAQLLSLKDGHSDCLFLQVADPESVYSDSARVQRMDWAFDDLIMMHLQVLYHMSHQDYQAAYGTQAAMLQLFNKEVLQKEKELNWFMPILYTFCSDLRFLARVADLKSPAKLRQRRTEASSFYEEAAAPIIESYRICVSENKLTPNTKKVAILNITNQLFRIYFRTNRLQLMKPLIRSIEHVGDLYESFSLADRITYKYYLGRKAMFDMDLPLAEESLSFAFRHCPNSYHLNKRAILIFLVPVKMFLGHMPTTELLEHYNLDQFTSVVTGVKQGNLRELNAALQRHQNFFIECGIFLMLEKLKVITFRNLFKKVAKIAKTHMIKLDAFLVALRYMGSNMDADELACILTNLIAEWGDNQQPRLLVNLVCQHKDEQDAINVIFLVDTGAPTNYIIEKALRALRPSRPHQDAIAVQVQLQGTRIPFFLHSHNGPHKSTNLLGMRALMNMGIEPGGWNSAAKTFKLKYI